MSLLVCDKPSSLKTSDLKNLLQEHLELTKSEAVAQLNGDYEVSIAAFDKVKKQAMEMSDTLADAIIKQFPEKFA